MKRIAYIIAGLSIFTANLAAAIIFDWNAAACIPGGMIAGFVMAMP